MSPEMVTAISTVLVPLCSLIAAIITARFAYSAKQTSEKTNKKYEQTKRALGDMESEMQADSGQTLSTRVDHLADMVNSQGHQLGEIRADMNGIRKDLSTLITNEILK